MSITQSDIDALLASADGLAADAESEPLETTAQSAPPASEPQRPPRRSASNPANCEELERILGLSLPLSVRLAQQEMPVRRVLEINVGVIIEFDRSFDAELDLMIGNCRIGTGMAVKVGENFGLRVNQIGDLHETIEALAGQE